MQTNFISLPNILTVIRIILIPIFIITFYLPFSFSHNLSVMIFTLASITDWLDGYLARKLKQISSFGEFLDPVADKLLVVCSLLILIGIKNIKYITIPSIIIIVREIIISALREWVAKIGNRINITVNYIGKIKTTLQMLALFFLIAVHSFQSIWTIVGAILLYIASILTIWSMIIYITIAYTVYKMKFKDQML